MAINLLNSKLAQWAVGLAVALLVLWVVGMVLVAIGASASFNTDVPGFHFSIGVGGAK